MKFVNSTRVRAGLLVVACALVGGTGCITMSLVDQARIADRQRELQAARRQRIAELTPRAQAGEPVAMTALAIALTSVPGGMPADVPAALDWLGKAAGQGDAAAQALLGTTLAQGAWWYGILAPLPQGVADRPHGIALLQQAASQACRIDVPQVVGFDPAERVGRILEAAGRLDDALLWRARDVVHCHRPPAATLALSASAAAQPVRQRRESLALLMLTGDRERIDKARATMSPDDVAAAEAMAEKLPHLIAESERHYPAPARKEFP